MNLPMNSLRDKVSNFKNPLIVLFVSLLMIFLISYSYYDKYFGTFCIRNPFFASKYNLEEMVCTIPEKEGAIDKGVEPISEEDIVEEEETESTFSNLLVSEEGYTEDQLSSISEFLEYRKRVFEGINTDHWNWESDFAYAYVYRLDPIDNLIYMNFNMPDDQRFQTDNNAAVAKVSCTVESTAIVNRINLEVTEIGINIFEKTEVEKDEIFFKCLNDKCDEIGGECIIVKDIDVE